MIGLEARPLAAIPSEFSGRAKIVGCPWCQAVLMLVMDEDGRGTEPLEVHGSDLAESSTPGSWNRGVSSIGTENWNKRPERP
jgi:hypothetical protein